MNVLILTVFLGLVLVSFFIFLFLRQSADPRGMSSERDALLPLQEDGITHAKTRVTTSPKATSHHE